MTPQKLIIWLSVLWLISSHTTWAQLAAEEAREHPLLMEALEVAKQQDYERANQLVNLAEREGAGSAEAGSVRAQIAGLKQEHVAGLERSLQALLSDQASTQARGVLLQLVALGLDQDSIVQYRSSIENIERYGQFQPGQIIQDSMASGQRLGPELVVIPQGQFMMGSSEGEPERASHEGPRHRVMIAQGFVVGRFEVTVQEFAVFVEATGYRTDAERRGRGRLYDPRTRRITEQPGVNWRLDYRGRGADLASPVIHVSWRDAKAYVVWLSEETQKPYRLLSEAEFEYVLRAGSQWTYPWGSGMPDSVVENLAGNGDRSPTQAAWSVAFPNYSDGYWGPAPAGNFPPNRFGLYDIGGNVMEWTEDCWHDSYVRAPADGSAWVNRGCGQHVVRGGSWAATPPLARSAHRMVMGERDSDVRVGFRVARDL